MIVTTSELLNKLSLLPRRNKKPAFPILEGVLMRVCDNILEIQGTDTEEYFIKMRMKVSDAEENFATVVLPQPLINFLKGSGAECSINFEDGKLVVRSNSSTIRLNTMLADEYPAFPADNDVSFTPVPVEFLETLKTISSFAATAAESYNQRYEGVLLCKSSENNKISVAATDTFRLAHVDVDADIELEGDVLIPANVIKLACNLFREGEVLVGLNNEKIVLKNHEFTLIGRLLEGGFPDYKHLIPRKDNVKAFFVCSRSSLTNALKVLSAVKPNVVSVKVDQGKVLLSAEGENVGHAEANLEVESTEGSGELKYNLDLLNKSVSSAFSKKIQFALCKEKPSLITGAENEPLVLMAPVIEDY